MVIRSWFQTSEAKTQVGQPSRSPFVQDKLVATLLWWWRASGEGKAARIEDVSAIVTKRAYGKVAW